MKCPPSYIVSHYSHPTPTSRLTPADWGPWVDFAGVTTDGATKTYTYDNFGNILSANGNAYGYTDTQWRDKLTSFAGVDFTYDESGNPEVYYNGTLWQFQWGEGRKLMTATATGTTVSYQYDLNGIRTSKTVNGVKHDYIYAGGKLIRETYGTTTLDFVYDASGNPYAMSYNGTMYYYILNLQGDVVKLVDEDGVAVATYQYNAWGEIIDIDGELAETNPLRYRGYYYDAELGMYYLQSRYYDPAVGRFINADVFVSTGQGFLGYNMFAYCLNDPVNGCDPCGSCFHRWDFWNDCEDCADKTFVDHLKEAYDSSIQCAINMISPVGVSFARELHYNRNELNNTYTEDELFGIYKPEDSDHDKFHQNNQKGGKSNRKYVIGEWFSSEVVFYSDGTLNDSPEDRGTFNVYSGDNDILNALVHGVFDVLPYMIWGNAEDDSTTIVDRIWMGLG